MLKSSIEQVHFKEWYWQVFAHCLDLVEVDETINEEFTHWTISILEFPYDLSMMWTYQIDGQVQPNFLVILNFDIEFMKINLF